MERRPIQVLDPHCRFTELGTVAGAPSLARLIVLPQPHSFRHYLKSQLLDREVQERISDAITGHKTPGIGRKYEHVELSKKIWAIDKLPVIPLPDKLADAA